MPYAAYTLIEMLVALITLSVICLLAMPSWQELIEQSYLTTYAHRLLTALNYSRQAAIYYHNIITICPTEDRMHCIQDWSQGFMVFIDKEGKGICNANDQLLKAYPKMNPGFRLEWRGFPKQDFLSFHPSGYMLEQNGSFYLCPRLNPLHVARVIVISKSGRSRIVMQPCQNMQQ